MTFDHGDIVMGTKCSHKTFWKIVVSSREEKETALGSCVFRSDK